MKIVVLDAITLGDVNWEKLKEFGSLKIFNTTNSDEVIERVKDADIIITNKVVIDKNVIDNALNLKLIQVAATGTDNIDIEYANSRGITVKNVVGYSTDSVVQLTFALALSLICKIKYFDKYTRENYANSGIFTHIQNWYEIKGKTWGVIGLGNIGKKVAKIAECFGANVIYYSTSGKNFSDEFKRVGLKELLSSSDIISIHAPLNDNTKNLLNFENLSLIKENSILINAGRGGIVNEQDLAEILKTKNIFVGLDVFEKEPVNTDNPLLKLSDQTVLTPHIAWTSMEARERLFEGIYGNIKDFTGKIK